MSDLERTIFLVYMRLTINERTGVHPLTAQNYMEIYADFSMMNASNVTKKKKKCPGLGPPLYELR